MKNSTILIVDDNKSILSALEMMLEPLCQEVIVTSTPNQIPFLLSAHQIDVVLLDMNFSAGITTGNEGLYWLNRILEYDAACSVIMITAYGDIDLAVRAVKDGAADFVLKPWDNSKLMATVNAAVRLRKSRREVKSLKAAVRPESPSLIGDSPLFKNTLQIVAKVAATDANVLITGENGTGKELIAREIHLCSLRSDEIMVSVDMGSLSESLFESELFGHVKGAFTDAHSDRAGKFELANGGTLFLDEIANLSLPMQAKLLAVLQNREVVRVGSNKKIPVDIRLVCATNSNLNELVAQGRFREDLLYRINTIHVELPPLRNREGDVVLLAQFFIDMYCAKYRKPALKLSSNAEEKLTAYHWPGNVRELQHAVEKAVILSDGTMLSGNDFLFTQNDSSSKSFSGTIDDMEKMMICSSLRENDGNMTLVATKLGITRQTLYNKMKKYGL